MSIPDINKNISNEVQQCIDKRISELFIQAEDDNCKPYVCILCDIFVKPKEVKLLSTRQLLKHSSILKNHLLLNMSDSLKSCYTIKDLDQLDIDLHTAHKIKDLILSPRSTYIRKSYREEGFVICQSCNYAYCKGDLPLYSITNSFFWNSTRIFHEFNTN